MKFKSFTKNQQLEIWNCYLDLLKEKQVFELEKMKIEGELVFKKEKHQMMEELKKKYKLPYEVVAYQLNSEGFGSTTYLATPMNTAGRPEKSSRFSQSTDRELT